METPTLLLSTLLLLLASTSTLSELCDQNDKRALLQIKKAFNNPVVLSSWKPESDCCTDWYSVTCHRETNRINSLTISGGLSAATIPPEIADLEFLENLVLIKHKSLAGAIPTSISRLRNLAYLTISWTGISGGIPAAICKIKTLRSVDLSFNFLSGEIPRCLSQLPSLGSLHLDRNNLSGRIPDSIGNFPGEDFYLYLSHNRLSGQIPTSLWSKKDFVAIDLSWNELGGDALGIFSLPSLERLDLSRNSLEFDLSKVRSVPRSLTWLDLSHNRISGTLPADLTELNLVMMNVSYNRLCGRIPSGGVLQTRFGADEFSHNLCLCGSPLNITCSS